LKMFDANKIRMIGLPYGEKNLDNVKPFSSNTRRTDGIAISIARVEYADARKIVNKQ